MRIVAAYQEFVSVIQSAYSNPHGDSAWLW